MRKIILFIATSLDGYIARENGSIDWLFSDQDYGYSNFMKRIDTLLIGGKTFRQMLSFNDTSTSHLRNFVFTRSPHTDVPDYFTLVSQDIPGFTENLKKEKQGRDIWLVGGAEIISQLQRHQLIDEFIISIHPIILGRGIPLFRDIGSSQTFQMVRCQRYSTGLVQLVYRKENGVKK